MASNSTPMSPSDLPADVVLSEIIVLIEPEGRAPPLVVVREIQCQPPKKDNYYLRGQQLELSATNLLRVVRSGGTDVKLLFNEVISPIRVMADPASMTSNYDTQLCKLKLAAGEELDGLYLRGVEFFHRVCLPDQKEQVLRQFAKMQLASDEVAAQVRLKRAALLEAAVVEKFGDAVSFRSPQLLQPLQAAKAVAEIVKALDVMPPSVLGEVVREVVANAGYDKTRILCDLDQLMRSVASLRTAAESALEASYPDGPSPAQPPATDGLCAAEQGAPGATDTGDAGGPTP